MSTQRMMAINELYMSSPSIQAARAILQGQLLSSGIKLRRKGEDVELEEAFQKHLQAYWLPFAKDVIDHFLQFGFCVVAIDQQEPEPFSGFKKFGKQTVENYARQEAGDAAAKRRKGLNGLSAPVRPQGSAVVAALQAPKKEENLIPFVPSLGTYEVSFVMGGRAGYRRFYRIFTTGEAGRSVLNTPVPRSCAVIVLTPLPFPPLPLRATGSSGPRLRGAQPYLNPWRHSTSSALPPMHPRKSYAPKIFSRSARQEK